MVRGWSGPQTARMSREYAMGIAPMWHPGQGWAQLPKRCCSGRIGVLAGVIL